jgi:hypothetical protein
MNLVSRYLVVLSALLLLDACERAKESDGPPAEQTAASSEDPVEADDESAEGSESSESEAAANTGAAPQTNVSLERIATAAGYQRVEDLPDESLPTIPADAQRMSGVYESSEHRAGLILVRYPREGFARPHVEDISRRAGDEPIAGATHGAEVLELRAADASTARAVADRLADELNWTTLPAQQASSEPSEAE